MKKRTKFLLIAAIASFLGLAAAWPTDRPTASDISTDPRYQEIWKKSQIFRDQNSYDSTPIEFSMAGVNYKVPRNYIIHMNDFKGGKQTMVTFKVTYPGFKPLSEETKQCLTQPRAYWPEGCIPIEFWINGQGKEMPIITDEDHFNNIRGLFHSQTPKKGIAGFEVYYNGGHGDELTETYIKKTSKHTLLFNCMYFSGYLGKRDAVCGNYDSLLPDGNSVSYRLNLDQMKDAEIIDDGMRSLVDSFALTGEEK